MYVFQAKVLLTCMCFRLKFLDQNRVPNRLVKPTVFRALHNDAVNACFSTNLNDLTFMILVDPLITFVSSCSNKNSSEFQSRFLLVNNGQQSTQQTLLVGPVLDQNFWTKTSGRAPFVSFCYRKAPRLNMFDSVSNFPQLYSGVFSLNEFDPCLE